MVSDLLGLLSVHYTLLQSHGSYYSAVFDRNYKQCTGGCLLLADTLGCDQFHSASIPGQA